MEDTKSYLQILAGQLKQWETEIYEMKTKAFKGKVKSHYYIDQSHH